ncbi:cyclic nucleotide-binding/CBS domain-containing protein [Candidatus Aenigmatarchaeota archaeon]
MEVSEFMNKNVKIVTSDTKIKDAAQILLEKKIGSVVVVDKEEISGIVTERDVIKVFTKEITRNDPVSKIMTKKVIAIEPATDIIEAIDIMAEHSIKKIIVVEEGQLIGIVTATDILKNIDESNKELLYRLAEVYSSMGDSEPVAG